MLQSHPQKKDLTLHLLPLAKENLHTSNDLIVNFVDLEKYTREISEQYGYKFDFTYFEPYHEQGIDLWHFQILTN